MDNRKRAIGILCHARSRLIMTGFSQQGGRNHVRLRRSIIVRAC
jgi:hypothetical protein